MQKIIILVLASLVAACQLGGETPPGTPETPGQSQQGNQALGSQTEQQSLLQATPTPTTSEPTSTPVPEPTASPSPEEPQPSTSPSASPEQPGNGPVLGEHPVLGTVIFLDGDPTNLSPENIGFPAPGPRPTPEVRVTGYVYDDESNPQIEGVTVKIQSLREDFAFEREAEFQPDGRYYFQSVPCGGINYLLTVSKEGFHERKRIEPLQCNDLGTLMHEMNRFDFGIPPTATSNTPYGSALHAFTKKPFVVRHLGEGSTSLALDSYENPISFRLRFSKPMDTYSVENNLAFKEWGSRKLTVDKSTLNFSFPGAPDLPYSSPETFIGENTLTADAFHLTWNTQQDELSLILKSGYSFPKDTNIYMRYLFSFEGPIVSLNGVSREGVFFEENFGRGLEHTLLLTFDKKTTPLKITQVTASPQYLKIFYDQTMAFSIASGLVIAGGMGDRVGTPGSEVYAPAEYPDHQGNATGRNVAANYTVSITPSGTNAPRLSTTWKALGGTVIYDPEDDHKRSVLLQAPINTQDEHQLFTAHTPVLSTALTQPLASSEDSSWHMSYNLVQRDGGLSETFAIPDLGGEALNATAFVSKLQTALNTLQPQRWQVVLSDNQQTMHLRYADPSGETLGWQALGIASNGSGHLPETWATQPLTWPAQSPFPWFSSGEHIKVEAATTIMDPAGNTLDPAARSIEVTVP